MAKYMQIDSNCGNCYFAKVSSISRSCKVEINRRINLQEICHNSNAHAWMLTKSAMQKHSLLRFIEFTAIGKIA